MSKSQKLSGFPIPEIIETEGTRCVAIQIPDHDDYHRALIAQVTMLGKWWKWERTSASEKHGLRSAQEFRNKLLYTEVGESIPCEILSDEGGIIVTTEEQLCKAFLCALGKAGSYVAAGVNSGDITFSINEDGEITFGDEEDGAGLPEGITGFQQLSGSTREVRRGINEFLTDLESFYDEYETDEVNPVFLLNAKYKLTDDIVTAYAAYDAYRDAAGVVFEQFTSDLDQLLFCEGIRKATVAEYVIDSVAGNIVLLVNILNCLSEDQYQVWTEDGAGKPNDDYLGYYCYIRVSFSGVHDIPTNVLDASPIPTWDFGKDRRVRITASGRIEAPSGEWFDMRYWYNGTDTAQHNWLQFNTNRGGDMRPPAQLALDSTNHTYTWITTMKSGENTTMATRVSNLGAWQASATGEITYTVEDLGEA